MYNQKRKKYFNWFFYFEVSTDTYSKMKTQSDRIGVSISDLNLFIEGGM